MLKADLAKFVQQAVADGGIPRAYELRDSKGRLLATVTVEPPPPGLVKLGATEFAKSLDEVSFHPAGAVCNSCGRPL